MRKKFFSVTLVLVAIATISFTARSSGVKEQNVEATVPKSTGHQDLAGTYYPAEFEEHFDDVYKDLQTSFFRSTRNWELIYGLALQNFTEKTSGDLELIPCAEGIRDFCYLPISDDAVRDDTAPAEDAGWTPLLQNANGNYALPLDAIGEYNNIAIRYSISEYTFYGALIVVKYQ